MQNEIYLVYSDDCYYPDTDFDSSSDNIVLVEFYPLYLTTKTSRDVHSIKIDFDPSKYKELVLLVVRYTDGDTFGQTEGLWYVVGCYEGKEEAEQIATLIKTVDYKGHKPWCCHVGGLDNIEIITLPVKHE